MSEESGGRKASRSGRLGRGAAQPVLKYSKEMARVRLFHWKAEEARPLVTVLQAAGHSVDYQEKLTSPRELRESVPDAYVIDLSRVPSHGREVAVYLRGAKATRHVPIVFVGGERDKIDYVKRALPDAAYTAPARLKSALKSVIANPPANPLRPAQMMERWGHRTTAQKLGIVKDSRTAIIDPPHDYAQAIGALPEGAELDEESTEDCKIALWFVHGVPEFHAALPRMRKLAARSRLWILWRKKKADGLDGNFIRKGANEFGLVDYKICSLNDTWSGMVFAVKKASVKKALS